jgi:hypothetical protein
LPASWLFRAHDIAHHGAERFETWDDVEYFRLHPDLEAACLTCADVTCTCPYGIDVPQALIGIHDDMIALLEKKLVPPPEDLSSRLGNQHLGARVVMLDIPSEMMPGDTAVCRVHLENAGSSSWLHDEAAESGVTLSAYVNGSRVATSRPRGDVHAGERGHFVFELTAPSKGEHFRLRLKLLPHGPRYLPARGVPIHDGLIRISQAAR